MYYQSYFMKEKGLSNAFAEYGTLVHSIMERYAKGELGILELPDVYIDEFSKMTETFPKMKFCDLKETYYKQGLEFLQNFSGYDKYKILDVEQQFEIPINDFIFNGIIDLIFEDENGNLVIQDYKSKAKFKNKKEQAEYARQLYLYSLYIKNTYGKFPSMLKFSMFRHNQIIDIPFDEKSLTEAITWATNTVDKIRKCWDYERKPEEFFCKNICNYRETCNCF